MLSADKLAISSLIFSLFSSSLLLVKDAHIRKNKLILSSNNCNLLTGNPSFKYANASIKFVLAKNILHVLGEKTISVGSIF